MESIWTDARGDGLVDGYSDMGEAVSYTFTVGFHGAWREIVNRTRRHASTETFDAMVYNINLVLHVHVGVTYR